MRASAIVFVYILTAIMVYPAACNASLEPYSFMPSMSGLSSFGFPAAMIDSSLFGLTQENSSPFSSQGAVASLTTPWPSMNFSSFGPDMSSLGFPAISGINGQSASVMQQPQMPASFSLSDIMASTMDFQPAQNSIASDLPGAKPSTTDNYSESSNGKTIKIKLGDVIHVQLKSRIDQGYTWNLSATEGLNVTGERMYSPQQFDSSLFDGETFILEATQEWDIQAIKPGTQVVTARYKTSADGGPYDKTFTLTVIVE